MPPALRTTLAVLLLVAVSSTAASSASGLTPPAVVVAVVDTGVDASQPELAGRLVPGVDVLGDGGSASTDASWHGTAVATIVVGVTADGLPTCDTCRVMPVKAIDATGTGSDAQIARGVDWAVRHGADVVNLSLSGPTEAPVLRAALARAARAGVVVVAAAGNEGTTQPAYPAADTATIGVAAITRAGRLYGWSNRGGWVAVAAPGVNVSGVPGGGTFAFVGTSSAAAVVSHVAALCLEVAPALRPAQVRRALVETAAPLHGGRLGAIDAVRAVARCASY